MTDLAIVEEVEIVEAKSEPMQIQPTNMNELARVSAMCFAARGSFVPSHYKSEAEIGSAIMLGQEMNLGVMTTLQNAFVVNGKIGFHYSILAGIIRREGYSYSFPVQTSECVTMETVSPAGKTFTLTWDKAKATESGLWGKGHWKKDSETMLIARCISHTLRQFVGIMAYDGGEISEIRKSERAAGRLPPENERVAVGVVGDALPANFDPSPHSEDPEERDARDELAAMQMKKKMASEESRDLLLETLTSTASEEELFMWVRCNIVEWSELHDTHRKWLWKENLKRSSVRGKVKEFGVDETILREAFSAARQEQSEVIAG